MTDVVETSFELPTIEQVASILAMCEKHDLPLSDLPNLWDKYTALQKVERRAGIQNGNMDREIKALRERNAELEALGLECAPLLRQITALESRIQQDGIAYQDLSDKYEALRLRCKHFEAIADQRRLEDLEDLVEHYRSGMNGMKELAANKHFSHQWRLWLITRTLNVFEPTVKGKADA